MTDGHMHVPYGTRIYLFSYLIHLYMFDACADIVDFKQEFSWWHVHLQQLMHMHQGGICFTMCCRFMNLVITSPNLVITSPNTTPQWAMIAAGTLSRWSSNFLIMKSRTIFDFKHYKPQSTKSCCTILCIGQCKQYQNTRIWQSVKYLGDMAFDWSCYLLHLSCETYVVVRAVIRDTSWVVIVHKTQHTLYSAFFTSLSSALRDTLNLLWPTNLLQKMINNGRHFSKSCVTKSQVLQCQA